MALENPTGAGEHHEAEKKAERDERPPATAQEYAVPSPAGTPEQEAERQEEIAKKKESLPGHPEKGEEGREGSKEHSEKESDGHKHASHSGHDSHDDHHKKGWFGKVAENIGSAYKTVNSGAEYVLKTGTAATGLLTAATIFGIETSVTAGAAGYPAGFAVAGWLGTTALPIVGSAFALFTCMLWLPGLVTKLANYLNGTKPAKSAAKASGGDHGGGHGH